MYDVYQIMAGDTIDAIANKFGTNSSVIRQLNPNSGFGVGSMIVVPVTNQYFDIYAIKKGDSLYEIARKYNTDYNLLAMFNGISINDYIYPLLGDNSVSNNNRVRTALTSLRKDGKIHNEGSDTKPIWVIK